MTYASEHYVGSQLAAMDYLWTLYSNHLCYVIYVIRKELQL